MTLESVFTKTSTLLARGVDQQELNNLFYSNLCGELDGNMPGDICRKARWLSVSANE